MRGSRDIRIGDAEIMGPLIIPGTSFREVKIITDNWLSKMLPEVLKYVRSRKDKLAMFHSVPVAALQEQRGRCRLPTALERAVPRSSHIRPQ